MHLNPNVIWLLLASSLAPASAVDYCAVCPDHTMCRYPSSGPGPACVELLASEFTGEQVDSLVRIHNIWRDYVAAGKEKTTSNGVLPTAANMGAVTWSGELATVAQRHALQCQFQHDTCRNLPHMTAGQNLAIKQWSADQKVNLTDLALQWYKKEVQMFDAQTVSRYAFSEGTGHFSQWIWGHTYKIGCGYTKYKNSGWFSHLLTCNYGPAGNMLGAPVYLAGAPCSKCPEGTTCGGDSRYPHLCAADDSNKVPETEGYYASAGRAGGLAVLIAMAMLTAALFMR